MWRCVLLIGLTITATRAADLGTATVTRFAEQAEFRVTNTSWSGSAFDLVASATFLHDATQEERVTEMFYCGENEWAVRFTGTQTGAWSFTTHSDDGDLDGHTGTVEVTAAPPGTMGYLGHVGNKFAVQDHEGVLQPMLYNVFQYDDSGPYKHVHITDFGGDPEGRAQAYADQAKHNGCNVVYVMLNHNTLEWGAYGHDDHSSEEPDLFTFDIIERVVRTLHANGIRIHFWMWGDEARKWTPIGLDGGKNGVVDQRVQRYFAARIGPLPGWAAGYGFDLQEWVSVDEIAVWQNYLNGHSGWEHFLCARGKNSDDAKMKSYSKTNLVYADAVANLDADTTRPHLFEERDVYNRGENNDATGTRRRMWHFAVAGGHGCWWGFFGGTDLADAVYPNANELRTHRDFWQHRFLFSMARANALGDDKVLATPDGANYVFYAEDRDTMHLDLRGAAGPLPAVAVDCRADYAEIDLGDLAAAAHEVALPHASDWAIAVGDFATNAERTISMHNGTTWTWDCDPLGDAPLDNGTTTTFGGLDASADHRLVPVAAIADASG